MFTAENVGAGEVLLTSSDLAIELPLARSFSLAHLLGFVMGAGLVSSSPTTVLVPIAFCSIFLHNFLCLLRIFIDAVLKLAITQRGPFIAWSVGILFVKHYLGFCDRRLN